jgi:bacillithiol synthase
MNFQLVDTPLVAPPTWPEARETAWLPALRPALSPGRTAARLDELGCLVVTTGQQPGLLTGPLYTIHKALSARALARALEAKWQRPVVPVFWVAGDDHDYAEGAVTHWLALDGTLETGEIPARPADAPLTPLYREPVPPEALELLDRLQAAAPAGPARDETLGWLRRHYATDRSLAAAFQGALAELFDGLGIVCLDASAPVLKALAWPILREALTRADELDRILTRRAEALITAGDDPGVKVGDGASLVMLEAAGGRDRLLPTATGATTRRSGEAFDWAALDGLGTAEPERFSPNVLLRPVVESALLPTVAYVAGPGELRYLRLAEALYAPLGVDRQLPTPRWSGLVVEPRIGRSLDKLAVTIDEALDPSHQVDARIARELEPPGFAGAVRDLRAAIDGGYDRVVEFIRQMDPTLEKPANSTRGGALNGLADLEKRVLGALKRKQGESLGQLERIRTALAPLGSPQERVLGLPGLTARYGLELVGQLADHVEAWYRNALVAQNPRP